MLCLLLPGSGCQAQSVTHPLPASPAAPSPRPLRLSLGLPFPFASIASWKQVFALNVLEATEPQSLSEESSPVPSSGLLRGPGQVLGLVGLAELNLPPAVAAVGLVLRLFSVEGERLQKGPIPQADEISRGSQPGRGGHSPHSQNELGPRKLQDPAHCHHGENGLHLG